MGDCLPEGTRRVLDLGSGGGVPGLVLAVTQPGLHVVLLDSGRRRCRFLRQATSDLDLDDRVEVVEERAEIAARHPDRRGASDVVVARSFGSPAVTAECAVGFLRPGGWLVVSEPPGPGVSPETPAAPDRWPPEALAELGLAPAMVRQAGGFRFARLEKLRADDRWPRRVGIPAKRPRF
ncbi:MAG: class I SAM-dependent methyltransferase [Actinomycetota bacterium]|nr:class I SAM-dependent methyltransferase [Actinomycetota bacterium]